MPLCDLPADDMHLVLMVERVQIRTDTVAETDAVINEKHCKKTEDAHCADFSMCAIYNYGKTYAWHAIITPLLNGNASAIVFVSVF